MFVRVPFGVLVYAIRYWTEGEIGEHEGLLTIRTGYKGDPGEVLATFAHNRRVGEKLRGLRRVRRREKFDIHGCGYLSTDPVCREFGANRIHLTVSDWHIIIGDPVARNLYEKDRFYDRYRFVSWSRV